MYTSSISECSLPLQQPDWEDRAPESCPPTANAVPAKKQNFKNRKFVSSEKTSKIVPVQ